MASFQLVCNGAMLTCPMGTAPSTLMVLPKNTVNASNLPAANIMDNIPFVNILPFGTCNILTAAALGVPTPCVPATVAPWTPGASTVMIKNMPALTNASTLICSIGGTIMVSFAGQTTTMVT